MYKKNKLIPYNKIEFFYNILIFIPFISFVLGFYFNENSAGSGEFAADSSWIRENIKIFIQNDLHTAIFHPELFGNRTPLIYILNKLFNPFFNDFEKYRFCVFIFSLFGPIFFYQLLKLKFYKIDRKILLLISSLVYLSPYYRTSAYWGLNENYGIIAMILSFFFLFKFLKSEKKKNINIVGIIFFSTLAIYFDQKFLIVPLICYIKLILSQKSLNFKIIISFTYAFLAIPYLYLFYKWGGIVPPATQISNPKTVTSIADIKKIYFIHIGYASTLISFYLLPIILFTGDVNFIIKNLNRLISDKINYLFFILILVFFIYLITSFNFAKFTIQDYWVGLGVVHKLTELLFNQVIFREITTYFFFLCSFIVLLYYVNLSKLDGLYISYFIIISLFLWPLMQEYFDPIILIISFILFNSIKNLTRLNSFFLFVYTSVFLIIANYYYI
jgi:hypothetical protein